MAAKQMNTRNNFVSEICSNCWLARREFSTIPGNSNISSEVIQNKPDVIQFNIHQHLLCYSIIFSVVSERRSKAFQGNTGNSKNVQKQPQVEDSGSLVLGLRCRGPLQPVGTQITAGPCLWGLRLLVKAVRQVAMPPSTLDQIYIKHEHLCPLLLLQAGTALSGHKGYPGQGQYFIQDTCLVSILIPDSRKRKKKYLSKGFSPH